MPRTHLGHFQRAIAGRFAYGRAADIRLRRYAISTLNPRDTVRPAPVTGNQLENISFVIPANAFDAPLAIVPSTAGTRVTFPGTVTIDAPAGGAVVAKNASLLPFPSGALVADVNTKIPRLGTGTAAGIVANAAYPRKPGTVKTKASMALTLNFGDGTSQAVSFSSTVTRAYALSGTYTPILSTVDMLGRPLAVRLRQVVIVPTAPIIVTAPVDVSVTEPAAAAFSVTVGGEAPFTYQWQRSADSGANWNNIALATASTYTLDPTAVADSGDWFRVVVTNSVGVTESAHAVLTVAP